MSVPGCRGSASRRFGTQVLGLDEVALFEVEFVDEFIDGPVDAVGEGAEDLSSAKDQSSRVGRREFQLPVGESYRLHDAKTRTRRTRHPETLANTTAPTPD